MYQRSFFIFTVPSLSMLKFCCFKNEMQFQLMLLEIYLPVLDDAHRFLNTVKIN